MHSSSNATPTMTEAQGASAATPAAPPAADAVPATELAATSSADPKATTSVREDNHGVKQGLAGSSADASTNKSKQQEAATTGTPLKREPLNALGGPPKRLQTEIHRPSQREVYSIEEVERKRKEAEEPKREIERERERRERQKKREMERVKEEQDRRLREEQLRQQREQERQPQKSKEASVLADLKLLNLPEQELRAKQQAGLGFKVKRVEKELEQIRMHYLGMKKEKKKIQKPSEKFRNIFNFEWDASEDTMRGDNNPLYQNRLEPQLLFGRGFRAGMDIREQRKANNFYDELVKR
ncbi:dead-box ATP-dependent RNA helicase [Cyclospora cayetanensis]|uniref:Dead-box ATP-dependent RNA helicase n=1 Tax=Cyclospora cayetanensis TaxID=88456 RepID=A0A1D3CXR9_9EIME|nr:dead-box ATP-dependent RNA helicase [Cyclospora cayetanensis]